MRRLGPQHLAAIFQSVIQGLKVREDRGDLPQTVARIADVLLNLTFLPSSSWIAKLRLKDIVAGHC